MTLRGAPFAGRDAVVMRGDVIVAAVLADDGVVEATIGIEDEGVDGGGADGPAFLASLCASTRSLIIASAQGWAKFWAGY